MMDKIMLGNSSHSIMPRGTTRGIGGEASESRESRDSDDTSPVSDGVDSKSKPKSKAEEAAAFQAALTLATPAPKGLESLLATAQPQDKQAKSLVDGTGVLPKAEPIVSGAVDSKAVATEVAPTAANLRNPFGTPVSTEGGTLKAGMTPTRLMTAATAGNGVRGDENASGTAATSTNTATATAGLKPWETPAGIAEGAQGARGTKGDAGEIVLPIKTPERGSADEAVALEHLKSMGRQPVASSSQLQNQFALGALGAGEMNGLIAGTEPRLKAVGKSSLSGADFLTMRNLNAGLGPSLALGVGAKSAGKSPESGEPGQNNLGDSGAQSRNLKALGESLSSNGGKNGISLNSDLLSAQPVNPGAAHAGLKFGGAAGGLAPETSMQAHVTTGSMAKDRLSSESLLGLGMNIRNLAPQGGGEIHIKLQPENLGELHLRVVTDGNQVGLRIQASDDRARKILESSLTSLQDSLASHQLSLKSVEFTVAQAGSASPGDFGRSGHEQSQPQLNQNLSAGNQWSPSQQGFRGDTQGQGTGAERAPAQLGLGGSGARALGGMSGIGAFGARSQLAASNGRLDVMA
jgi:hypothetical protein